MLALLFYVIELVSSLTEVLRQFGFRNGLKIIVANRGIIVLQNLQLAYLTAVDVHAQGHRTLLILFNILKNCFNG